MKKSIILFFAMLMYIGVFAQTTENVNLCGTVYTPAYFNTISTDWRNQLQNKINTFNWTNQSTNIKTFSTMDNPIVLNGTNYYGADDVELPFYRTTTPNVNNPNLYVYDINPFNANNLDIHPEDGWELVQYDFGGNYLNANIPATANEINNRPHLIIYNRYNSKIRIYFLVPHAENFNGAYIQARFPIIGNPDNNVKTALFSRAINIPANLIAFDPAAYLTSTTEYTPSARILQWIYGEFDVAYDPCTCKIKNETGAISKIVFNLYNLQLTKIDLEGESTTQAVNIADPTASGAQNTNTDKTSFSDAYKEGQKYYKQWSAYRDFGNTALDQGYTLWSKKLAKTFFKEYKGGITDPSTGLLINDLATLKTTDLYQDWLKADQSSNKTLQQLKFLKNVASVIPYVGVAIGLVDYLSNGGKKTPETVAAPSVSYSKYKFKGTLTYTSTYGVTLNTPGARNQAFTIINASNDDNGRIQHGNFLTSSEYPMYNEPLGVFNVLNAPKFEIVPMQTAVNLESLNGTTIPPTFWKNIDDTHKEAFKVKICEVKMKEIPKFVVNPSAGLELLSIDAAIVLEYTKNNRDMNLYHGNYKYASDFSDIPFHPSCFNKNISLENRVEEIEQSGLELEYVSNQYPNTTGSVIRFRTKYTPLECLTSPSFISVGWNNHPKVFIKYLVRFKRKFKGSSANIETNNSQPEPGIVNLVYTIDVTEAYSSAEINEVVEPGSLVLTQTPDEIYMSNGQSVNPANYSPNSGFHSLGNWRPLKIQLNNTTFYNPYALSQGQNVVYNNQLNITTSGEVLIPDNSIVINGSTIIAKGKISIGNNVTINRDVKLISEEQVSFDGDNITTDENSSFEVTPNIWTVFCSGGNTTDYRATDTEIQQACSSTSYTSARMSKTDNIENTFKANEKQLSLSVYPNPTNKNITINFDQLTLTADSKKIDIDIFDIMGKKVYSSNEYFDNSQKRLIINIDSLNEGVYFLKVNVENKTYQEKFIKNRL